VSSSTRDEYHTPRRRRLSGRASGAIVALICVLAVVAVVNLAIALLQFGGIGNLHTRLGAIETLAAFDDPGKKLIGKAADRSLSRRDDSHAPRRMQAWTVSVYPLPRLPVSIENVARTGVSAGSFVHSGSWIALNEHEKHDGLLELGMVALNIKGVFLPEESNRYVFRLDLRYAGALKIDKKSTVFACYGRFGAGRKAEILSGKIMFNSLKNQSRHRTLIAKHSVPMTDGTPYQLKTTVFCNLPSHVRASDVMFRLSVRPADVASFASVNPVLWPPPAVTGQSNMSDIQVAPSSKISVPKPNNSKKI
jgi:hypothetical protein